MKAFQKFIFLSVLTFVLVGAWYLSAGIPFFEKFPLNIYGFLSVVTLIIPSFAYVYIYERLEANKKAEPDIRKDLGKSYFITFGLIVAVTIGILVLVKYFVPGKFHYSNILNRTFGFTYFLLLTIGMSLHRSLGKLPIIRLKKDPIFYLQLYFFSILGACISSFLYNTKLTVNSTEFIIDSILFSFISVTITFFTSLGLNEIPFFRKNFIFPVIFTGFFTFWSIKILGYPQNYFRILIKEEILLIICLILSFMIVSQPAGRIKRGLKIRKLTSNLSKKEAEYLQLKNQINPHFLFNNLNVLVSFIELNPKKAVEFGHHLSNVYRHYLKNQTEDYVSLEVEINFITEYLSIYKAKFEKGFTFKMPEEIAQNQYVLPNCLQELIDNIFKHNVVAEEIPLEITIFIEANTLVIQNTIHKKEIEIASNFGLENINKRYLLLTNNDIQIMETPTHFSVKILILELES